MRMKVFLLLFVFCIPNLLSADPITKSQARAKAKKVFSAARGSDFDLKDSELSSSVKSKMPVSIVDSPAFYAFNSSDGKGFVLVSGDDDFPEVIAYSDSGMFDTEASMSPALISFLECYSEYVNDVRSGNADAPSLTSNALSDYGVVTADESSAVVGPLCTAQWSQGYPYNYYCPVISGDTCAVGCLATAMAQILYYWQFPERATGTAYYNTQTRAGIINEDLSSDTHVYDWDNMHDTSSQNRLPASRNAVSRLSYDCGIAVEMQYDTDVSGAYMYKAYEALYTNFYYDASTIENLYADYYATNEEWYEVIRNELDNGRPVLMGASSSTGSGRDSSGHAFVIDGYDSNGYVHVNWGWNGSGNGYFDLSVMNVSSYRFTSDQNAIVGITPGTGLETRPQAKATLGGAPSVRTSSFPWGSSSSSVSRNSSFSFTVPAITNYDVDSHTWTIGVGLYDKYGEFLEIISATYVTTLSCNVVLNSRSYTCQIPSSYEEGDYVLKVVTMDEGFDEWILPYVVGGEALNAIPVYVTSSSLNLNEVSTSVSSVEEEKAVVSHEYFDVSGRKVEEIEKGQYGFDRQTFEDGTVRSVKIYKR